MTRPSFTMISACGLLLAACSGDDAPGPGPGPAQVDPPPPTAACDSLSRSQCMEARHCRLIRLPGDLRPPAQLYECRPASGPCEEGLLQNDRAGCVARSGCVFDEESCYCHCPGYGDTRVPEPRPANQGCACACGMGSPAICRSASAPPPAQPPPTPPPVPGGACDTLTRHHCLHSASCRLVRRPGEPRPDPLYECRPASGPCEEGLTQLDRPGCEARAGCAWQDAHCYCGCRDSGGTRVPDGDEAESCDCACGGGTPAACVPAPGGGGPADVLVTLRARLDELAALPPPTEPVTRGSDLDVAPLVGRTRDELRAALGQPNTCEALAQGGTLAPCRTTTDWFYSFYRLPDRWRGGGPELLLTFDAAGRCTAAAWTHTR